MTILELAQGSYGNLDGVAKDVLLAQLQADDVARAAALAAKYPDAAQWRRPRFTVREVPDTARAPWGYHWYRIDGPDGIVRYHSEHLDSSG